MMPGEGNRDREELLIHHHDDGSSSTVQGIRHQEYHRPRVRILDSLLNCFVFSIDVV